MSRQSRPPLISGRSRRRLHPPGLIYDGLLGPLLRGIRRRVAGMVRAAGTGPCLDVCCGTGRQVRMLREGGVAALGLDLSRGMIGYAAAATPGAPFVRGDARRLPFKDAVFAAVVLSFGLHDKDPADRPVLLAEARRVLSPGGLLVLTDFERAWNSASRLGRLCADLIETTAGPRHFRNGRDFLRGGGLAGFVRRSGLRPAVRHLVAGGSLSVTAAANRDR